MREICPALFIHHGTNSINYSDEGKRCKGPHSVIFYVIISLHLSFTSSRIGWSVVRSKSLAKGGTSKRDRYRPSTKFRLGLIRRVHELFKRPSLLHPKKGSFKKTVTQTLTTVSDYYVTHTTVTRHNSQHLPLHNSGALPPIHEPFKRHSHIGVNILFTQFLNTLKVLANLATVQENLIFSDVNWSI
jgi:hypothetical protein